MCVFVGLPLPFSGSPQHVKRGPCGRRRRKFSTNGRNYFQIHGPDGSHTQNIIAQTRLCLHTLFCTQDCKHFNTVVTVFLTARRITSYIRVNKEGITLLQITDSSILTVGPSGSMLGCMVGHPSGPYIRATSARRRNFLSWQLQEGTKMSAPQANFFGFLLFRTWSRLNNPLCCARGYVRYAHTFFFGGAEKLNDVSDVR